MTSKTKIVFEIANNHSGSLEHLKDIVDSISQKIKSSQVIDCSLFEFAFKFQFRDLETFISPIADASSNKHIDRFLSTRLSDSDWREAIDYVRSSDFLVQVTPFDEASVYKCLDLGVDDFKVASCSATDWSLLDHIAKNAHNVTFSTGGLALDKVDNLYSYFTHRDLEKISILHCCGIYPAPLSSINMSTLPLYAKRYPKATIGYSGHEDPSNHLVSLMAFSCGALVLERHVGKASSDKGIALNSYSLSPDQVCDWVEQIAMAMVVNGLPKTSDYSNSIEKSSLRSLQRGAFAIEDLKPGDVIPAAKVNYAFPPVEDQLIVEDVTSIYNTNIAKKAIAKGSPILASDVETNENIQLKALHTFIHKVRGILNQSGYSYLPRDTSLEISHHYGIENLNEYGCCLINVVNRNYCKKLIIVTKGQVHPEQKHEIKEEYFIVISGKLKIVINGKVSVLNSGDSILVPAGALHEFSALEDTLFEEVSTTSITTDSYYTDNAIQALPREQRKTTTTLHF